MKQIFILTAVLLLALSGCSPQNSEDVQAKSSQQESAAPEGTTEDGSRPTLAADASEKKTLPVETEPPVEMAATEAWQAETETIGMEDTMQMLIGETEVPATWEDNASVDALQALCPLTIQMSMYGGFEQVGPIGQSIISHDVQTSTNYGDIVLYNENQIVVFYGSNSWAYTRLGHVNLSQDKMRELLGNGDVVITLDAYGRNG